MKGRALSSFRISEPLSYLAQERDRENDTVFRQLHKCARVLKTLNSRGEIPAACHISTDRGGQRGLESSMLSGGSLAVHTEGEDRLFK